MLASWGLQSSSILPHLACFEKLCSHSIFGIRNLNQNFLVKNEADWGPSDRIILPIDWLSWLGIQANTLGPGPAATPITPIPVAPMPSYRQDPISKLPQNPCDECFDYIGFRGVPVMYWDGPTPPGGEMTWMGHTGAWVFGTTAIAGDVIEIGSLPFYLIGAPTGAAAFDIVSSVGASISVGETFYGRPSPECPVMLIFGQDPMVTSVEFGISGISNVAAFPAPPALAVDFGTSAISLGYDIGRHPAGPYTIPTYMGYGIAWDDETDEVFEVYIEYR